MKTELVKTVNSKEMEIIRYAVAVRNRYGNIVFLDVANSGKVERDVELVTKFSNKEDAYYYLEEYYKKNGDVIGDWVVVPIAIKTKGMTTWEVINEVENSK